jgi:tRNA pseudouridine55 synthase
MLEPNSIIPVYKPEGLTSYRVVNQFKQKYPGQKIGHGGTLDPLAEGVLLILLGKATKQFESIRKLDKEYDMTMQLGWQTDTGDREGKIIAKLSNCQIDKLKINTEKIEKVLQGFVGEYEQEVPFFSAVKYRGKPLYAYARQNKKVPLPKKTIKIKEITLLLWDEHKKQLRIKVVCSGGTYLRSLAVDIGKKLNIPAVVIKLIRTRIGQYSSQKALVLKPPLC